MSDKIKSATADLTDTFVKELQTQIARQVQADVAQKLSQIDINATVRFYVNHALEGMLKGLTFPPGSIPGSAIDISSLRLVGENIMGGTHKIFMSTGIQDTATDCKVTILDSHTVFENNLLAPSATIKGDLVVEGNLDIKGEIPEDSQFYRDLIEHSAGMVKLSMDDTFFKTYADTVFTRIKDEGIDLAKLSLNGREILVGNKLGNFVTETNIQTVGELKALTVNGTTSLADTMVVVKKRVGINTEDPSEVLSIWDAECEVVVRKLRKDVSSIGSTRNQAVVLSSNSRDNLTLETDGSVSVKTLKVGDVKMSSSNARPNYVADAGTIVWNSAPAIGTQLGWVNIGGANWANIGAIS